MDRIERINTKTYPKIKINNTICFEHRYVWEQNYGKNIKKQVIYHINKNKKDNRIENLMLLSNNEHSREHRKQIDTWMRKHILRYYDKNISF